MGPETTQTANPKLELRSVEGLGSAERGSVLEGRNRYIWYSFKLLIMTTVYYISINTTPITTVTADYHISFCNASCKGSGLYCRALRRRLRDHTSRSRENPNHKHCTLAPWMKRTLRPTGEELEGGVKQAPYQSTQDVCLLLRHLNGLNGHLRQWRSTHAHTSLAHVGDALKYT